MMRLGIFGGTFAPFHLGHRKALEAFFESARADRCLVIPAGIPPHKKKTSDFTDAQRLEMTRLAFGDLSGAEVSDIELSRGGRSYTVETLRELAGDDRRLFFLCGTDMMLTLDQWREPDEIFRLCYPVYIRRESDEALSELIVKKIAEYNEKYGKVVRKILADPIDISSSEIRSRLSNGQSVSDVLPATVEKYIFEHHLYV